MTIAAKVDPKRPRDPRFRLA